MKPYAFVDLDGTIMDSMFRQYQVFVSACDACQYQTDISYDVFASKKREGYSTKAILNDCGIKDIRVSNYWKEHIEDICWLELDGIYGDAEEFLRRIAMNYCIVILTARKNDFIKSKLRNEDIGRYITDIKLVSPEKPYEGKKYYIAHMPYEKGMITGDTEVEYQLGKEFGLDTFLLNRGFRSERFWKRKGVQSFDGLTGILHEIYRE